MAGETVLITFGEAGSNSYTPSRSTDGVYYNKLSTGTKTYSYYKEEGLLNTEGIETGVTVSIRQMAETKANISSFVGDSTAIYTIFPKESILGVLTYSSPEILYLYNLSAGSYTLHILAGRGNSPSPNLATSYSLTTAPMNSFASLQANIVAYNATGTAPTILDGVEIKAFTNKAGSQQNSAADWVLMQFDFTLEDSIEKVGVYAVGFNSNVAGIALTCIPEPSGLCLLGAALTLLATRRKRGK